MDFGRISLAICFDINFAEIFHQAAALDTDVMVWSVPSTHWCHVVIVHGSVVGERFRLFADTSGACKHQFDMFLEYQLHPTKANPPRANPLKHPLLWTLLKRLFRAWLTSMSTPTQGRCVQL
jgi:hypothetical protein